MPIDLQEKARQVVFDINLRELPVRDLDEQAAIVSAALAAVQQETRQEIQQVEAELLMAKQFLHEAGTDPEAWIDGCLERLGKMLALRAPKAPRPEA